VSSKSTANEAARQRGLLLPRVGARKNMKLYYHKTDRGAEYLMDTFIKWKHNGKSGKEGILNDKTKYIVRIDGDIEKKRGANSKKVE